MRSICESVGPAEHYELMRSICEWCGYPMAISDSYGAIEWRYEYVSIFLSVSLPISHNLRLHL